MKRLLAISAATAVLAAVSPFAIAQSSGMKGMDMKMENKAAGQSHKGTGKVTKVDPAKNSVTIAHEPISTMYWPATARAFRVKDKALLQKVKQGEKVDFEFVQQGKDYVVTAVK